jgi:hypothetical protein
LNLFPMCARAKFSAQCRSADKTPVSATSADEPLAFRRAHRARRARVFARAITAAAADSPRQNNFAPNASKRRFHDRCMAQNARIGRK